MPMVLRALLLSALLTLLPVGIGVAVSGDATLERRPAAYRGTDLAAFDTTKAVVQRAPFCDLVPAAAVREALGEKATLAAYGNGEQSEAFPGGEVAHEYGCRFAPADATADPGGSGDATVTGEARGWVFAPPVTAEAAQALAESSVTKACAALPSAPAYGAPSTGVLCAGEAVRTASFRGLFGDAWLACSLTLPVDVPEDDLVERAGRWCVAVAQAASVPLT
ncbi:hypothetical protein FHP29_16500 [Nocardioides albidus]|uniref:DUF3558 domain-containing protein n=1 Tax=Nocardioides albidus TaxID=1517589 RepID=A0A5C4VQ63_9ACTN|nr:hypothetical protein [Nocardioides albidus]TNM37429.1 hypothetical protein FHP29_16500 [Nocardioides albidus]